MKPEASRTRFALSALAFGLGAPCVYFAERAYERRNGGVETPLTILRSLHTGYYYRVGISLLLGLLVAWLCALALELRPTDGTFRATRAVTLFAFVTTVAFGWLALRFA